MDDLKSRQSRLPEGQKVSIKKLRARQARLGPENHHRRVEGQEICIYELKARVSVQTSRWSGSLCRRAEGQGVYVDELNARLSRDELHII